MAATLDAVSHGSANASSVTVAHTTAGASRLLVVGIAHNSGTVTGVTYNGVALTKVNTSTNGNSIADLYYLLAPATGTHNVVVTNGSSFSTDVECASFNGLGPTQTDATTTNTASATTSCANTLTTVTTHALHVATFGVDSSAITSITNGTIVNVFMGYTLDVAAAGSHSLTGNSGGNNAWATVGASFASGTQVTTNGSFLLNFI